jgi:hypothetical protein
MTDIVSTTIILSTQISCLTCIIFVDTFNPVKNGEICMMDERKMRGLEIAALADIAHDPESGVYYVPSQNSPRPTTYTVTFGTESCSCTCPDFETRRDKCKHIWAVQFVRLRQEKRKPANTENVETQKHRKTYPQDWKNYNQAQTNEKRQFQILLHDLCKDIPTPPQGGARPTPPASI